ncbi:MAG: hypothetical protein QXF12_08080 [Candidatus Aenigmatarchaeota archaeon]|jgi:hypothetical protein
MKLKKFLGLAIVIFMSTPAFSASLYHQVGVGASTSDDTNFDNSQGVATQIYVTKSQGFTGGGVHYFWPAMNIKKPGSSQTVFVQMGYYLGFSTCTPYPFVYIEGSNISGSNIFKIYTNYPLQNNTFYTFWFETDGIPNQDGTYNWDFWFWRNGINDTKIQTVKLESKNSNKAPFLFSEVAGATSNACTHSFSIQYGWGQSNNYALLAKKNGVWSYINHVKAHYFYEPCNSNVRRIDWQIHVTEMPATRTTCEGCQVW